MIAFRALDLIPMNQPGTTSWVQRFSTLFLGGVMAGLVYLILAPFFSPILWAALFAYVSWPAYRRLRARVGERRNLSACLAVLLLAVAIIMPMLWLAILVKDDLSRPYNAGIVERFPLIERVSRPEDVKQYPGRVGLATANWSIDRLGDIGRNAIKIVLCLMVLFCFYRDGETVQLQLRKALRYALGNRSGAYLRLAGRMSRVIVQSALLAALLQGVVAGLGYWVSGAQAPALLAVATALASLVPVVGTTLVWGAVGGSFIMSGDLWKGLGILAWSVLAVHLVDNIIRPALISNSSQLSFVLVMFGVLGGIATFGLIGIFLGPVILAIASTVWKEWIDNLPSRVNRMDY